MSAHSCEFLGGPRYAWTRATWTRLPFWQCKCNPTVRWCVRDEETSEVKDCAERSVALPREQSVDGIERRKKEKKEEEGGGEEGPAFSEIIVLAISVSRRQRTRFICRVYCRWVRPTAFYGCFSKERCRPRDLSRHPRSSTPSPSRSVTELFSLSFSFPLSFPVVFSVLLVPTTALIRYTRVAPRETEGFLMNATTESSSRLSPSRLFSLSSHVGSLAISPFLSFTFYHVASTLSLWLVSVVSATSFAPHINARFIPQNPGRYRIYIFVASL